MLRQRVNVRDHLRVERERLQGEPLVDHQRIVLVAVIERRQPRLALGAIEPAQHHQRALTVGHVVGRVILLRGKPGSKGGIGGGEEHQRLRLDLARAARRGIIERDARSAGVERLQFDCQRGADRGLQPFARGMDRARIGLALAAGHPLEQIGLGWQHHQFAAHRIIERRVGKARGKGTDDRRLARRLLPGRKRAGRRADEVADREFLQGFRAGEGIIVMRGEEHEVVALQRAFDHHRRGKSAVDRHDRVGAGERKDKGLLGLGQHHQLLGPERAAPTRMYRDA